MKVDWLWIDLMTQSKFQKHLRAHIHFTSWQQCCTQTTVDFFFKIAFSEKKINAKETTYLNAY